MYFLDADQQNVCLYRNQKKAYKYYGTVLIILHSMNVTYVQHLLLLQRIDMVSKGFSCLVDYAIRT